MAISPEELRNKTFAVVSRGYDRPEVNRYLGAIADELNTFNNYATPQDAVEPIANYSPDQASDGSITSSEAAPPRPKSPTTDSFDRVGSEISLMLRQAQESATKIRSDAEIEAGALVEQVRLDIEADRVAHEQAARELIARTEERALSIRVAAEDLTRETHESAERYAITQRDAVDAELADATSEAAEARELAAEKIAVANDEAAAILADARAQSQQIIDEAEAEGHARRDELLQEANVALGSLIEAETRSREELELTRRNITSALAQLKISELDQKRDD